MRHHKAYRRSWDIASCMYFGLAFTKIVKLCSGNGASFIYRQGRDLSRHTIGRVIPLQQTLPALAPPETPTIRELQELDLISQPKPEDTALPLPLIEDFLENL